MVLTCSLLALVTLCGFAQASPAPQITGEETTLNPSKALQSGLPTESGLSTDSIAKAMSWYKNTHRDDFALYPFGHRDAGGWQELSAAANALMKFHPDFIAQAIFGASDKDFSLSTGEPFTSTFQDKLSWTTDQSAIWSTDPTNGVINDAIRITDPKSRPAIKVSLNITLFPLAEDRICRQIEFMIDEERAGDSAVVWPLALMEAYMRPDVQNELKNRKYLDFKEGEDAEKFTPSWDHMLYGKEDREAFATQEARVKLAKAAMYLLTGLKADGQVVGKYSDIPGPSAKPDKVLQGGDLEPDTNNQYILVKGNGKPYIINGPTLVLTKDGGLRALYDDGQDWLLLDSRARLYPGDTKDVYKTRPSEDSGKDTEAFDRLLYNETPRNAIGIAADGMEKLNKVKQGDPTEISKFIKHPENFLFGVKAGVLGRRRDSATGPYVSRRTARA